MQYGPVCRIAGLAAVATALGPLDRFAHDLFAVHMAQHLVLMDVAAPLLVLGAGGRRVPALAAAVGHAAVLWGWHVPAAFAAALAHPALHAAMHASFLGAGAALWWALLDPARRGAGAFWALMTLMHGGLLSALVTLAPTPLYGHALADQQLAGLLMWGATAVVYTAAGLALAADWLRRLERVP